MYFSVSSHCLCTVTTVGSLASLSPNPQSRAPRRHRSEEGEGRKAGEGIYVLCGHCVSGLSSSISEHMHQPLHKLSPSASPPAFPWASTQHHPSGWKCPADGARPEGRAGAQKARRKGSSVGVWQPWCLFTGTLVQPVSQGCPYRTGS